MALSGHDGGTNINSHSAIGSSSLRKLCALLKNEGHRVLSGNSAFTLTTEVLSYINGDCRRHSVTELENHPAGNGGGSFLPLTKRMQEQHDAIKARTEWAVCIQFIKDFMLSTPSLKVLHNSSTLSAPISLHRFGNLSCLHLRRVPIHMVEGLQHLRHTLSSITVYRCVDNLKDLLESCGGDMSAPLTWPALKFVSFMFNSLSSLDDSLRLLPFVEVLDLSHNLLETCATHLECLGDVISVTLAYNNLVTIPTFSLSTRSSLTFLILRGNNLDRINGIDALTALQELDLGENCLNDHSFLEPFSALVRLKQLQLDGNPIYYHRFHRPLTVSCLARQAVTIEFELDKKKLTLSEISHFMPRRGPPKRVMETLTYPTRAMLHSSTPERENVYGMSPSSGIGTENESTDIVVTPRSAKKGKRKRLKPRNTRILDMDTSGDLSSGQDGTPGSSPVFKSFEEQLNARREEARKTQKEIEELRQHYGPDWLQAIEDRNIFNTKRPVPVTSSLLSTSSDAQKTSAERKSSDASRSGAENDLKDSNEGSSKPEGESDKDVSPTDDELYLRDNNLTDSNNPIMAAIARLAAGESGDEIQKSMATIPTSISLEAGQANTTDGGLAADLATAHSVLATGSGSTPDEQLKSSGEANVKSPPRLESQLSRNLKNHAASDGTGSIQQILTKTLEKSPLKRTSRDLSLSSLADTSFTKANQDGEHEMTEAMFISLPLENDKMIIVSLTDSSLVEKDIRMIVREKLDLANLTSMETKLVKKKKSHHCSGEVMEQTDEAEEEVEVMQVDLKFEYTRKDRQHKCYHMDAADAKILISHLQPFLDAREEEAKIKSMIVMQCLKCNRTFLKSELVHQRKQLPTSGSSRDLESLQELMDKTTLICPKCGSSIIIELESAPNKYKSQGSTSSTPAGSYTSAGSFIEQANKIPNPLVKRGFEFYPRKNSTGSHDFNVPKKTQSPSTKPSSGSWTRDNLMKAASSAVGRDRSNAFNASSRMVRSVIVPPTHSFSESEELICVEDYFAPETMTTMDGDVIKRSDSNSSITILPTPVLQVDQSNLNSSETTGPVARPVKFSIGTPSTEEPVFISTDRTESRVVSPLSLDICTSMVSSVYDTSINALPGSDPDPTPVADANHPPAPGSTGVVIVGSNDSRRTNSSENLTSIYDSPQLNPVTEKLKFESRHKSRSGHLPADQSPSGVVDPTNGLQDTNVGLESSFSPSRPALATGSVDYALLAGYGSDESSEDEAEDLVPHYAFHHLNHHLTLYMMMSLFGNDEEFVCKIQSEIVQYMIEETYEGILVMSSSRFYILKITSEDHSLPPDQWLTCVEIQPIPELRYIDVGLGAQSLRLEFVTDCSSYTLITRNRDKTSQFVELLHTNLAKYAVSQGISSNVVVNEDVSQITLNNLDIDVVSKVQPDQKMLMYCMGYIERGNIKHFPVSFVITSSDICLVRTNHQWPQPRLQAPITVETVGKQFTVLERQKINNVAAVEVCETTMKKIRLELFNEVEGISVNWNITMATRQTTVDFINSLSGPWAQEFGVEMEILYSELEF